MEFDDRLTTIVYFAETLPSRYPEVFLPAKTNLESNGIKVKLIKGIENIWCRDYLPIQVGDHFVKFIYADSNFEHRKPPKISCWDGFAVPSIISPIILDGGNVVRGFGKTFITEKVLRDNVRVKPRAIIHKLSSLLDSEIILLPIEPGDNLGHSDGIVKFMDEKTILINDYSSIFEKDKKFIEYDEKLRKLLSKKGFEIETLPFAYGDWDWNMSEKEFRKQYPFADDFNPGFGYYINFLLVRGVILLPTMGIKKDFDVVRKMKFLYPHYNIVAIDCSHLSFEGGLMNCISWNIMEV
jgi:agmatine deiminase